MDEFTKQNLIAIGREDLILFDEINKSGYAGCLPSGEIVDRREFPKAIPVQANSIFGIPQPKDWPHSAITANKIVKGVWVAICTAMIPVKTEITMQGTCRQDAIDKLKKFFEEK